MAETLTGALVSAAWLAEHLSDGDIRILDCTWHHPSTNLDGRNQYRGRHLPGSVHFDVDHVADPSSDL
ncbi:MAG: sulfurtransferase, partial [Alphaproteobacteria bacterium]|nr:sulfurtransferase [Alphaproteobacteria bacterium]